MSEGKRVTLRAGLARTLAFARSAEPRAPLSRRAVLADAVIAAVVLVISLVVAKLSRWPGHLMLDPARRMRSSFKPAVGRWR